MRLLKTAISRIRLWQARTRVAMGNIWVHRLRGTVQFVTQEKLLWGPLALAIVILLGGLHYLSDQAGFRGNLVAEVIGLFLAFAVAWGLIERHSQSQSRRISDGVRRRIKLIRDEAARQVTNVTTLAFNQPTWDSQSGDIWYVKSNYSNVRGLLNYKGPRPSWGHAAGRDPSIVSPMFHRFDNLTDLIDRTIRLFGPGLLEHPNLLETFEQFENKITGEHERWERFWDLYRVREKERQAAISQMPAQRGTGAPEIPESPLVPYEALANLIVLASAALDIVVAVTLILKDWDNMPPRKDARSGRLIYGWRYVRNDYKSPLDPS